MNSGEDYIDKVLKELAENSYGNADTEYFTQASYRIHECINAAKYEADLHGRANEHWIISHDIMDNEDLAALQPATIQRLKRRKSDLLAKYVPNTSKGN